MILQGKLAGTAMKIQEGDQGKFNGGSNISGVTNSIS
jgi:hypothetical protein